MIDILLRVFLYTSIGFGVAAPFLPLWAMWRAALASGLTFIIVLLIHGPDDSMDPALLIMGILQYVVGPLILAMTLRLIIAAFQKRLTWARFKGPGWVWLDCALCDLAGLILGFGLFTQLAWGLEGAVGSWADWTLAAFGLGVGVGLTWAALRLRRIWPVLPAATLGALGCFALWGAFQPARIVAQAEALAQELPWCLDGRGAIERRAELGFLGLDKSDHRQLRGNGRHIVLFLETPYGTMSYYWSIRQQQFIRGFPSRSIQCDPSLSPLTRDNAPRSNPQSPALPPPSPRPIRSQT